MDILDRFMAQAKENIKNGYYDLPEDFENKSKRAPLKEKLVRQGFSLIAEIKHASPAGEYSFDNIDVAKAASTFRDAGADAISVVVEPRIFKGSLGNIPVAKRTGLPVLFKDFVLGESQIRAADAYGADAILLIVKVAERLGLDLDSLIAEAHSLGLEVLLECYDGKEMEKAAGTEADVLGINNRDLRTLKVDLSRTAGIMASIGKPDRPVISESGVRGREDAEFLKATGVKGILVGTALWKTKDQAGKIRELKIA